MEVKPKIFRIFYDDHLDQEFINYEVIYPNVKEFVDKLWHAYEYFPVDDFTDEEYEKFNQEIIKAVKENPDIKGVYTGYDIEAFLIAAVLNSLNLPSVKLPSLETVYQLHHKLYHKYLEEDPVKFSYFDLFDENWDQNLPKFPFYLKPTQCAGGIHSYIIRNKEQLDSIVQVLRRELPKLEGVYLYFAKKYLDLTKFPLATKHIIICEELMENFTNVNLDGYVDGEGNITTLLFSDQLVKNEVVYGYRFPSQIPEEVCLKAKKMGLNVIQKSCFRNATFNIEFYVWENGDIKIIETNPRTSYSFNFNYHIYGIQQIDQTIRLSMGRELNLPTLDYPLKIATQLYIVTKKSGKINDILNIEKCLEEAKLKKDYVFDFEHDLKSDIENNFQKNGRFLLKVIFPSSTVEDSEKEMLRLENLLLLQDDYFK